MLDPYDVASPDANRVATFSTEPYVPYNVGPIAWLDEDEQAAFPLYGPIHEYLHWITQTTHTPTIFHVGSYLTQLCQRYAALGLRVEVGGKLKRPRLYALLVAPSGVGKSTPINRAMTFFQDHCIRVPNVPVPQCYSITSESTAQGITRVLQEATTVWGDNEVGLFVCEEAERIFARARKHPVDALFCSLYDGNFTQHLTATNLMAAKKGEDEVVKLNAPIVSLLFAMPEASFIGDGMDKASDTGLIPRFMVFEGRIRKPKAHEVAFAEGYERASQSLDDSLVWFLQKRDAAACGEKVWPDDPENDPFIRVKLSQAAFDVYQRRVTDTDLATYDRIHEISDRERNFRAYRLRAYDQAYTVAALYALSRKSLLISPSDMQRALNLADMSIHTMEKMVQVIGKDEATLVRDLIRQRLGELSRPDLTETAIHNFVSQKFPDIRATVTLAALQDLITTSVVVRIEPPPREKINRGRPFSPRYALATRLPEKPAE